MTRAGHRLADGMARRAVAVGVLLLAAVRVAAAQERAPELPRGAISGVVVDAETREPIAGATVVLAPATSAAIAGAGGDPGAVRRGARAVRTGRRGRYAIAEIVPGLYHVRVERIGYRSRTVDVDLRRTRDSRVSIGLTVEPIALRPIAVRDRPAEPYGVGMTVGEEAERGRAAAVRDRQRQYLSTDVRALTHAGVLEAVTLGETDVFRALRRLPGVSARDDYASALWTRGSPWDHTRVHFDGVPLFNPVHAAGLFSGVTPEAIGAAFLHPGVREASIGGGAAGVVELRTRTGGGEDGVRGFGDLSLASARVALDQRTRGGRAAWMVSARRTYLDWATRLVERAFDVDDARVPYAFQDVAARLDVQLDQDRTLETSALWQRDMVTGDIPDVLHGTDARWGNLVVRTTLHAPLRGLRARHTVGLSRYGVRIRSRPADSTVDGSYAAPDEPDTDSRLLHLLLRGRVEPAAGPEGAVPWAAGYELVHQAMEYDGPAARAYARRHFVEPDAPPLALDATLSRAALWAERRSTPIDGLEVRTGLRLEAGPAVADAGAVRIAPRVTARYRPFEDLALSAALGRSYQYAQTLAPGAPRLSVLDAGRIWLLAGQDVPALRTDQATIGAEYWLGAGWLAAVNAYLRRTAGSAEPDPRPGRLSDRPLFVVGEHRARGTELSLRRIVGWWTVSVGYSHTRSEILAAGLRYPSPTARRHAVDVTSMLRLGETFRLGLAYTAASGAAFTRVSRNGVICDSAGPCTETPGPWQGPPGAGRGPGYSSVDLLLDWAPSFGSWGLGVYLQVRNVLRHDNAGPYGESGFACARGPYDGFPCADPDDVGRWDHFEPGLPILPLVGFRIRF